MIASWMFDCSAFAHMNAYNPTCRKSSKVWVVAQATWATPLSLPGWKEVDILGFCFEKTETKSLLPATRPPARCLEKNTSGIPFPHTL